MSTYLSSDWHFSHYTDKDRGVIQYCGRPFPAKPGTPEMNDALIEGLQGIPYGSTFYNLGDLWFRTGEGEASAIVDSIPSENRILIQGNHDRWGKQKLQRVGWDRVERSCRLEVDGIQVLLVHDPVAACMKEFENHVILCGHIHQLWRTFGRCINVGVDVWDFKPVSLETLRPLIHIAAEQKWEDYHDIGNSKSYHSRKITERSGN